MPIHHTYEGSSAPPFAEPTGDHAPVAGLPDLVSRPKATPARRFGITVFPPARLRPAGDPTDSRDHNWPLFGRPLLLDLGELEHELGRARPFAGKFQGEFYVGGHLRANRRLKSNVLGMDVLSIDVDHGLSAPQVHERFQRWHHIIWHTYRHRPEAPRCRVAIPLARTISAVEYTRTWAWATAVLGGCADPQAADAGRACMLPPIRPDGSRAVVRVFGDAPLLSPDAVMVAPPPPRAPPRPLTPVRVSVFDAERIARHRLRESESARRVAADLLEARIAGARAERIVCPGCKRRTVWFWLAPGAMSTARCCHLTSCGWYGGLDTLLNARGVLRGD